MIAGVDISNLNGTLDLAALTREHSLSFVFCKATEGRGFRDPLFPATWKALKALGLVRGAYHFGHPMTDATAQAEVFLSYVRAAGLEDGDLLALDLEVDDGRTSSQVAAWGREFCAVVHSSAGRLPLVYTFISFAQEGYCAGLGSYPLWIADPSSTPGRPRVPAPWKTWAIHQYGQQGLDLDIAAYPGKAEMTAALASPSGSGWTERMIANLPTLQLGAKDTAGHVFFVSRLQALAVLYGELNEIAAAACLARTGTFDGPTKAAVQAIQAHKKIAVDGIAGPLTWRVLITGNPA